MEIFCVNFSLSPFSPRARGGRGKSESSLALSSFLFPEDVMRCRREGASVPYRMRRDGPRACLAIQIKGNLGEPPKKPLNHQTAALRSCKELVIGNSALKCMRSRNRSVCHFPFGSRMNRKIQRYCLSVRLPGTKCLRQNLFNVFSSPHSPFTLRLASCLLGF